MYSKLNLIANRAKQDNKERFSSLIHHINEENLLLCFAELKRNKASGIDGVTVQSYEANLRTNISDLVQRLKSKTYRPQPVRRVYIPKPGKQEKRGLGIPAVEDKLVQIAMKKLLEAIFEQDFLDCSFGFRPQRSCHDAINRVDKTIMCKPINYVVEVDIKRYFDTVSHYWLQRCLEERISDPNFLWLVRRFLKAGYVDRGVFNKSLQGTPQGGIISPVLANIYLHYVLDLWFYKSFKPSAQGSVELIRYADDFVACCSNERDAKMFLEGLKCRLKKFNLEYAHEKTNILKFGRKAWRDWKAGQPRPKTFTFLGFTHFCDTSRRGKFMVGRKTAKESYRRAIKEINLWLKKVRCAYHISEWWKVLNLKLLGHFRYFGVSGNMQWVGRFYHQTKRLVLKWINRRSQKKSMTWDEFNSYTETHPLATPKIFINLFTLSPIGECSVEEPYVGKPQVRFCGGYHSDETA